MNHILIAEDEHLIARLVEMTLTRAGYRCTVAEDGRTAADLIEKTDFDMAILDIMLPGLDGYDLLASLKPQGVPVIFLTAKSAVKDRVLGLRLGADDYITKPFAAEELVARMETVLRRTGRGGRELRAFDIRLDTQDRTAWRGDEPLDLRRREFDLLELLMRNRGAALYRDVIFSRVWAGSRTANVCAPWIPTLPGCAKSLAGRPSSSRRSTESATALKKNKAGAGKKHILGRLHV